MGKLFKFFVVFGLGTLVMLWSETRAQLKCELTNDPAKIQLIDDDVKNFLRALDLLGAERDWAAIIQKEYLDKASSGLKEFLREKGFKAEHFVKAIRQRREAYDSLRDLPKQLALQEKTIRGAFAGLKKIIPNAVFMPVYYLVGPRPGALGEPSEYGLMISISELDTDIEKIHLLLVHETIHVQQALTIGMAEYQAIFGPKMSLLALSIREGSAYFLTLLSTGGHTHKDSYDYYIQNENELWNRFKKDMNKRFPGDWMWKKPTDPEQPPDLGYIVGARIVEAYYNNAKDKLKAVQDILLVADYKEFLNKSRYAEKFLEK
ncbi:MAG: hypothetical protein JSV96_12250 [Candidatus Aminicenantes bacterium]|nr:MAG: hypothetical protein JSV96_12250 [Candidatus Aminicenantes bacterium]